MHSMPRSDTKPGLARHLRRTLAVSLRTATRYSSKIVDVLSFRYHPIPLEVRDVSRWLDKQISTAADDVDRDVPYTPITGSLLWLTLILLEAR